MWSITNVSDRFFVTHYMGEAQNGIYSVAYKLPTIISVISAIFTQAWQLSAIGERESDDREQFYSNIFKSYQTIVFLAAGGILLLIKPLMHLLAVSYTHLVQEMVKESEVMQQAYAQANETINAVNQQAQEIIDAAANEANALRYSAVSYTDVYKRQVNVIDSPTYSEMSKAGELGANFMTHGMSNLNAYHFLDIYMSSTGSYNQSQHLAYSNPKAVSYTHLSGSCG